IVAYWRPETPLEPGRDHNFTYRMTWGASPEPTPALLTVLNTRMGARPEGGLIIAIDFGPGDEVPEDLGTVMKLVRSSAGNVTEGVLQRNPETGGPRLAFTFTPGDATWAEFRVQLRQSSGAPLSEVWLYRWTA
ncbi:MAG: glucan biosynthesis protein, partial [Pseudomonadota bacterium]